MTDLLFTYGTLQFPEVMQAVAGCNGSWREAWVQGYSQYRLIDRLYPGMIEEKNGVTVGCLYVGVDAVAWALLDRFEDPIYERQEVEVHLAEEETVKAQAYVVPVEYAHLLSGQSWTMAGFTEHQLKEYVSRCRWFYHMVTQT